MRQFTALSFLVIFPVVTGFSGGERAQRVLDLLDLDRSGLHEAVA